MDELESPQTKIIKYTSIKQATPSFDGSMNQHRT